MDCDRKATASIKNRRQAWDTEPQRIQSRISDRAKRVTRPTVNRYSKSVLESYNPPLRLSGRCNSECMVFSDTESTSDVIQNQI